MPAEGDELFATLGIPNGGDFVVFPRGGKKQSGVGAEGEIAARPHQAAGHADLESIEQLAAGAVPGAEVEGAAGERIVMGNGRAEARAVGGEGNSGDLVGAIGNGPAARIAVGVPELDRAVRAAREEASAIGG